MLENEFKKKLLELKKTKSAYLYTIIKKNINWLLEELLKTMKCDNCKYEKECNHIINMKYDKDIWIKETITYCSKFNEKK